MSHQEYEPFSQLWEYLARRLGLSSERTGPPQGGGPSKVSPLGRRRRRRLWWGAIIAAAIIFLFALLPYLIYLYTEYLWFDEVGFTGVFLKILLTKIGLGFAAAVFFFAVVYGNMLIARRMAPRFQIKGPEIVERVPIPDKVVRWLIPLGLLLPSLIVFAAGVGGWEGFLKFMNRTEFGLADPVFNRDAGFYVFTLPFLRTLHSLVWWTLILALLATAAIDLFDYAITWSEGRLRLAPHVKGHLSIIMGLIMFTLGAGYLLKGYILMYSQRGVVFGASYTDVHAQLPVYRILLGAATVAGILFLINIYFRGWKFPAAAIIIIIATAIFAGQVYPFIVQQYQVSPNELATEEPYIKHNIDFTRRGFDLESIEEQPFAAAETLTGAELQTNINTINNVRLWDPRTLAETYKQIQTIRPYYMFRDVDVDRYTIDGRLRQFMLSPREIFVDGLDSRARTWQNEHLFYTHGYGVVMSPVAQVTSQGLPDLVVKDIPPQASVPELEVKQPAVYFSESADDYIVVNTDIEEFDYPLGDENVFTTYEGNGGVRLNNSLRRFAFSSRYGSLKLLVSDALGADSRIVIHRQIRERIENIAPFLRLDPDPYMVLVGGRLLWIQDAYITSSDFPYSQPSEDGDSVNYIRNSVKIVVDAYNGDVVFYVVDESDPLIQAYQKMFPGLFTPGDQMSGEMRAHLRYPEELFKIQGNMYTTYHMTDPRVFYNKEDQWNIPRLQSGNATAAMDPYYVIMSLPGEENEQFLMMLPFTPGTRENIISWMAAKSDPQSYGERVIFKFPKEKLVFGPSQVLARFNQNPAIAQQITLWGQAGSQVIFGNLLVIPIEQSLLYVQPLYLRAERSQIPEMKRVLVSFGETVVMEEDLAKALDRIFAVSLAGAPEKPAGPGVTPSPPAEAPAPPAAPAGLKELAATAADHFNKAVDAQRRGDWATYGNELRALEETIRQMQAAPE